MRRLRRDSEQPLIRRMSVAVIGKSEWMGVFVRWTVAAGAALLAKTAMVRSAAGGRASHGHRVRLGRLAVRRDRVGGITTHTRLSVDPVPDDRSPVILVHGLGCRVAT